MNVKVVSHMLFSGINYAIFITKYLHNSFNYKKFMTSNFNSLLIVNFLKRKFCVSSICHNLKWIFKTNLKIMTGDIVMSLVAGDRGSPK